MRKYGKWVLTLSLLTATPGLTFAADTKLKDASPSKGSQALRVDNQRVAESIADALRDKVSLNSKDAQLNDLEFQLKDLNARKTDRGMVVTVGDILFDSGQARLLADGNRNMAKLADFFKRNPQRTASTAAARAP